MNFKSMRLYTSFLDNQDAIKMYEKEGFIGEKYTAEKLSYDCRIYSKSLVSDTVDLWNNKDLNLGHQSELDHMNDEKAAEKLEIDEYDDIEEDEELIQFLNETHDDYEIDDEYIYRPGSRRI